MSDVCCLLWKLLQAVLSVAVSFLVVAFATMIPRCRIWNNRKQPVSATFEATSFVDLTEHLQRNHAISVVRRYDRREEWLFLVTLPPHHPVHENNLHLFDMKHANFKDLAPFLLWMDDCTKIEIVARPVDGVGPHFDPDRAVIWIIFHLPEGGIRVRVLDSKW